MVFVGLVWSLALLLAVAGAAKLMQPDYTAGALVAAGVGWTRRWHVRLLAVAEITIGGAVVIVGSPPTVAALALFYGGFAGFTAIALRRRSPLSSCGCFGRPDTPPTRTHLVVNGLSSLMLIGIALEASSVGFGDVATAYGSGTVPVVLATAATSYLLYLTLSLAPSRLTSLDVRASA